MKKLILFTLCIMVMNSFSFAIEEIYSDFSLERIYSIKIDPSFLETVEDSPKILLTDDIKYDTHIDLNIDAKKEEEIIVLQYFPDEPLLEDNYIYFDEETGRYKSDRDWVNLALFLMQ